MSIYSDFEARKWINSTVIPVFNWNISDTRRHAREAVRMFDERCHWKDRFNTFKRWYLKFTFTSALYKKQNEFKNEM